jgi:hypothetical protein
MQPFTKDTKPASPMTIEMVPQYRCPACDSAIRSEAIAMTVDPSDGVGVIRVYCPHCEQVFESHALLTGGVWAVQKTVQITGRRAQAFIRAVEPKLGIQRVDAA